MVAICLARSSYGAVHSERGVLAALPVWDLMGGTLSIPAQGVHGIGMRVFSIGIPPKYQSECFLVHASITPEAAVYTYTPALMMMLTRSIHIDLRSPPKSFPSPCPQSSNRRRPHTLTNGGDVTLRYPTLIRSICEQQPPLSPLLPEASRLSKDHDSRS